MEKISGHCLDTDILIDYLRGLSSARIFLFEGSKDHNLWISVVSIVEVFSGKDTLVAEKKNRIDLFLKNFQIISLDEEIARRAGELRRDYKQPFADMIVAASAITCKLSIITRNVKHFSNIEGLEVISLY